MGAEQTPVSWTGDSIAISGSTVFVGSYYDDTPAGQNAGSVYVFDLACATCPGNLNGDGVVDLTDLATSLAHYGQTGQTLSDGDLNGDTVIDLFDLAALLAAYNNACE